jgi:hypothetical protein
MGRLPRFDGDGVARDVQGLGIPGLDDARLAYQQEGARPTPR